MNLKFQSGLITDPKLPLGDLGLGIGDWGLGIGIGDCGLGIGDWDWELGLGLRIDIGH